MASLPLRYNPSDWMRHLQQLGREGGYATRTDLVTPSYHGTDYPDVFGGFKYKDLATTGDRTLSRLIGPHVAPDPAIANSFAMSGGGYGPLNNPAAYNVNTWTMPGPHQFQPRSLRIYPVMVPEESRLLRINQDNPGWRGSASAAPWQKSLPDDATVGKVIMHEAYQNDLDLLRNYLRDTYGNKYQPDERTEIAKRLQGGDKAVIDWKEHDLKSFLSLQPQGGRPQTDVDIQRAVDVARDSFLKRGYPGMSYTNTAQHEAQAPGVTDPQTRSFIVFKPSDLRSPFAKFDLSKINSSDLMAGVTGVAVLGTAAAALAPGEAKARALGDTAADMVLRPPVNPAQPMEQGSVARYLWPGVFNPATYQPLPPPDLTPTSEGKLPSVSRDRRYEDVWADVANTASNFVGPW